MSKIIAIDAGHGLYTLGKRCLKSIDVNETREWVLNDRIADKLQKMLEVYDCSVLRVDDTTGKKDVSLSNRVKIANNANADIFISIHHNAAINGGSGGGTIVFYYSNKPERANQAQKLYEHIIKQTGLVGNRSSKVSKNGFYVIKHTNMPAFLIENGFMDSTTDTPIILTESHADKTANGILNYLVNMLNLTKKKSTLIEVESVNQNINISKLKMPSNVKSIQEWLNTYYNSGLKIDGSYGSKTKRALIKAWQKEVGGLSIDGDFGVKSQAKATLNNIKKNSNGILVTIWQATLVCKGYNPNGIDGNFGNGCVAATKLFQKSNNLSSDGVVGKATWTKAFR